MIAVVTEEPRLQPELQRRLRRPTVACAISLGVHAAIVLAGVAIAQLDVARPPRTVELTMIETVEEIPSPPPPPPVVPDPGEPGARVPGPSKPAVGTLGRLGRDAPKRSLTRAPISDDPHADLRVSYEAPTGPDPGHEAGALSGEGIGGGLHGDGTGSGLGGGQFGLNVPPPPPSLARVPRPRADYRQWGFRAAHVFRNSVIRLKLRIDPEGNVSEVQLIHGVESYIDNKAKAKALRFKFFPALDDAGNPTWSDYHWDFVLRSDEPEPSGLPVR